ncbi:YeiH family protein [Variovorax terrae]|uniref:Sulfate exporter family transporter n=1 Tax=Variovorax terrae TaxID=2923278 RepID=A0A9X2ANC1_9BURK|nr:putative sulfate exporter family transporter [Variovorax terrae]MCJ0764658.1 putative sulfate exporter family transporter [Variovorax terrae]
MFQRLRHVVSTNLPGVLVCGVIALAATFLSEHYGGPQLLYALLIGLAFHFLMGHPQVKPGIDFCGRTVLRIGVALLGARITLTQVAKLGVASAVVVVLAVALTILFGVLLARWLGRPREEGLLSGGAVGICGASAALAISSVLPQTKENERFTLLAVVGVTVLSTLAMVIYPFSLQALGLTPEQSGIFLGGTIHDVAQVVAAGMMLGPQAGDVATVVKLFRVMLLMPVVLVIAMLYRSHPAARAADEQVPLVPGFLLAFIVLVLLATVGVFTPPMTQAASDTSRWMLVTAIAAAGVKTSFEDLLKLGWQPVAMLVGETVFIAALVLAAVLGLRLG